MRHQNNDDLSPSQTTFQVSIVDTQPHMLALYILTKHIFVLAAI